MAGNDNASYAANLNQAFERSWQWAKGDHNIQVGNLSIHLYSETSKSTPADLIARITNMNPLSAAQAFLEESDPHTRAPALNSIPTERAARLVAAMSNFTEPDPISDNVAAMEYAQAAALLARLDDRLSAALLVRMHRADAEQMFVPLIKNAPTRAAQIVAFISTGSILPRDAGLESGARYVTDLVRSVGPTEKMDLIRSLPIDSGSARLLSCFVTAEPLDTADSLCRLPPAVLSGHVTLMLQTGPNEAIQIVELITPTVRIAMMQSMHLGPKTRVLNALAPATARDLLTRGGIDTKSCVLGMSCESLARVLSVTPAREAASLLMLLPPTRQASALGDMHVDLIEKILYELPPMSSDMIVAGLPWRLRRSIHRRLTVVSAVGAADERRIWRSEHVAWGAALLMTLICVILLTALLRNGRSEGVGAQDRNTLTSVSLTQPSGLTTSATAASSASNPIDSLPIATFTQDWSDRCAKMSFLRPAAHIVLRLTCSFVYGGAYYDLVVIQYQSQGSKTFFGRPAPPKFTMLDGGVAHRWARLDGRGGTYLTYERAPLPIGTTKTGLTYDAAVWVESNSSPIVVILLNKTSQSSEAALELLQTQGYQLRR